MYSQLNWTQCSICPMNLKIEAFIEISTNWILLNLRHKYRIPWQISFQAELFYTIPLPSKKLINNSNRKSAKMKFQFIISFSTAKLHRHFSSSIHPQISENELKKNPQLCPSSNHSSRREVVVWWNSSTRWKLFCIYKTEAAGYHWNSELFSEEKRDAPQAYVFYPSIFSRSASIFFYPWNYPPGGALPPTNFLALISLLTFYFFI